MRDLSDNTGWVRDLIRKVERLHNGAMLENASVTNGRLRFIGGLLRVDSGGRVEIVGTLEIDGETTVTGTFTVTGPWEISGDGTITGDVELAGEMRVTGEVIVEGAQPIRLHQVGGVAMAEFGPSGRVWSAGDGVTIACPGGGYITVYSGGVDIGAFGGTAAISGAVTMPDLTTAPPGVSTFPVVMDPATKRLYRA